ncbi:MAG: hypothetical protein ACE14M_15180 [Terriglobales bacterium]
MNHHEAADELVKWGVKYDEAWRMIARAVCDRASEVHGGKKMPAQRALGTSRETMLTALRFPTSDIGAVARACRELGCHLFDTHENYHDCIRAFDNLIVTAALDKTGSGVGAAKLLGVHRNSIRNMQGKRKKSA